jgi:parvulin-like peptidyl-prolyl cis-trans isomerase-like protein
MRWRLALLGLVIGCGAETKAPPPETRAAMSPGTVARVGPEEVSVATVARIEHFENIGPREALDRALHDAVLAAAARAELAPGDAERAAARVLARALLDDLWADARSAPITDADVDNATFYRWTRYDRPDGWRTIHAIVQLDDKSTPADRERARVVAAHLHDAALAVAPEVRALPIPERDDETRFIFDKTQDDPAIERFKTAMQAVDASGLKTKVEALHPITSDGRVIEHGASQDNRYDEQFAAAAAKLAERGDVSDVVETGFGLHVILLLERTPAKRVPLAERRAALRDDILNARARRTRRELVARLAAEYAAAGNKVETPSNADALLELVRIREVGGAVAGRP